MDINLLAAMMEQFKNEGGDMSALASTYQTLTVTGKTPLGLNQWVKSDKPCMEDFNEDNRIIDEKIRELQVNKANVGENPQWYTVDLINDFEHVSKLQYSKDNLGMVHINGTITRSSVPTNALRIGVLPEGFRPTKAIGFTCNSSIGSGGQSWATYAWVQKDGSIEFTHSAMPSSYQPNNPLVINVAFKAAQ